MFFQPPLFQAAKIVFHFKMGLGSCTGLMVLYSALHPDFQSLCGLINLSSLRSRLHMQPERMCSIKLWQKKVVNN